MKAETWKATNDDWHSNYSGSRVKVSLMVDMVYAGEVWHRVCVWGTDDDGMEIDFFGEASKKEAEKMYDVVIKLAAVDKPILKRLGFVLA